MTTTTDLGFVHGFTHCIDSEFLGVGAALLLVGIVFVVGFVLIMAYLEKRAR